MFVNHPSRRQPCAHVLRFAVWALLALIVASKPKITQLSHDCLLPGVEKTSLPYSDENAEDLGALLQSTLSTILAPGLPLPAAQVAIARVDPDTGDVQLLGQGSYGLHRLGSPEPQLATEPMRIGSCSKSFVSAIMSLLVERGEVSYQDRVWSLIGDHVPNMNRGYRNVRLGEVLSHTGGFTRDFFPIDQGDSENEALLNIGSSLNYSAARGLNAKFMLTTSEPGARGVYEYSNCGTNLAGYIIDKVNSEGLMYEQLVQKYIVEPLGLKTVSWANMTADNEQPQASAAFGYYCKADENGEATLAMDSAAQDKGPAYNAEGGLNMPTTELVKWIAWHLRGHKGFVTGNTSCTTPSKKQFLKMHKKYQEEENPGYGFFWESDSEANTFFHSGLVESFNTLMTAYLDLNLVVAITASWNNYQDSDACKAAGVYDTEGWMTLIGDSVLKRFTPPAPEPPSPSSPSPSPSLDDTRKLRWL